MTEPLGTTTIGERQAIAEAMLLSCPFCGAAATGAHQAGSAWFIDAEHAPDCHFADFQRTEAQALAGWNRRTTTNAPVDDREAVARIIDDLAPACTNPDPETQAMRRAVMWRFYERILALHPKTTVPIHGDMREALEGVLAKHFYGGWESITDLQRQDIVFAADEILAIKPKVDHWSDCATHNSPAAPCDCGGIDARTWQAGYDAAVSHQQSRDTQAKIKALARNALQGDGL